MNQKRIEPPAFMPWEKVTIQNNFMFTRVMMNSEICAEFLETMLGIKISRIEYAESEKSFAIDPETKGIRLDVYVKDSDRVFDIEMQCADTEELALRSRFYQSLLDTDLLDKGRHYSELPESYVIFICTFDPFKEGLPCYTFKNICKENPSIELGDKTQKVFYNINAFAKEENFGRRAILEYFSSGRAQNGFTEKIEREVRSNDNRRKWRQHYMFFYQELEDQFRNGKKLGAQETRIETAKNLVRNNVPAQIISDSTGLPLEEVLALS